MKLFNNWQQSLRDALAGMLRRLSELFESIDRDHGDRTAIGRRRQRSFRDRLCLVTAFACNLWVTSGYGQLTSLNEGFDNVGAPGPPASGIFASGWVVTNNSNPLGDNTWNQGIPGNQLNGLGVNAQSGAANSFIQTNFNAANGGVASDWLITPVLNLIDGATVSFYTQTNVPVNTQFPNELQVWESQSGLSTVNVGSTNASPGGDFTLKLLDINPGATAANGTTNGYPTTWTKYTLTISGLSGVTQGRIGFRYYLPDATTQGTTIGIDTFSYSAPTVFSRTLSGNWSTATDWTPNGVPNGNIITAQLVNPGSATNIVNLGGQTFTLNQLQFFGTGAGTWNVSNGTIVFDGANPMFVNQGGSGGAPGFLPNLQLNANTTFEIDSASALTEVTGIISGAFQLTKTGAGTLVLEGTNTYSGGTTISAGTLQIGNGSTTGSIVGDVTDNGALAFDRSDAFTYGGIISGTGGFVQLGIGTLILTGTNTYSGGTTITAGTLQIGNGGTTGSIVGNVTDNDVLAFDRSDVVTFGGTINGSGALVQLGTGTLILTGDSGYTGGTTISGGTLQIGNGGTTGSIVGNVTDNSALAFDRSDLVTFGGAISGTGGLVQLGSGTLVLTGTNSYTGQTTISAGTLQIGNGGTTGSIVGNVVDNGVLAFDRSDLVTFGGTISGAGGLVQLGSGTLVLTGNNTYSGNTISTLGTLRAGSTTALSPNSAFFINSTLDLNGFNNTIGSLNGAGTITNNGLNAADLTDGANNLNSTFGGTIKDGVGVVSLTKIGTGTLTLSGVTTYSGPTQINGGVIAGGALNSLSSKSAFVIANGAGLDISAADETIGSLSGVAGATVNLGAHTLTTGSDGTSTIYAGLITGSGGLTKIGNGTFTLSGTSNYTGSTSIHAGVLAGGSLNSFSAQSAFSILIGASLDISLADEQVGSVTGPAGSSILLGAHTLTTGADGTTTEFDGTIAGTGALIKTGAGTLTLTGANTYSGGTTVENGIVVAASNNGMGTGPVSVVGTLRTLQINAGVTLTNLVSLSNGGLLENAGTLNEGASNLTVTNGGTIANFASGIITANQLLFTSAGGALLNFGTINANVTFGDFPNIVSLVNGSHIVGNLNLGTDPGSSLILDGVGTTLLSQAITGTLTDSGLLTKQGTGTWTIDRDLSIPGGVNITAGTLVLTGQLTTPKVDVLSGTTLQLGNGGNGGSLVGNVVDNGSLLLDRAGTLTLSGIISGAGTVTQSGPGTTILNSINTYTGGTLVSAGTLVVNSSQALGLGSVVVNGGVLKADPQPINVRGDYTQGAAGTLELQVAGAAAGQYDFLNVAGTATLNGKLQLISLGYQPKAGDLLTLVNAGSVSGRFAQFVDPFTTGPGVNTIDLVYGKRFVQLQFLNVTTPISPVIPIVPSTPTTPTVPPVVVATVNFASFALTPNQLSAGNLVDSIELNPKSANLVGFLFKEPLIKLPSDLEKISPDALTAFYEIGFSGANIQRLNLEGRFDDIHNGSNGFSSNLKINGAKVGLEDKATLDGKSTAGALEPALQSGPGNCWGVWATGFGDFVDVDSDSNSQGYSFTTGGVNLGVDFRLTEHFAIGIMGNYSHTWTDLKPRGHIDVDNGQGGIYATWADTGFYLDAAIYGGHATYDSARSSLGGLATGSTEGNELSTFISGGYNFHLGRLTIGPIASLQYTSVNVDDFTEKGSLAPLHLHEQSQESLRTDIGFRASYPFLIGKMPIEPYVRAAWEHEFDYAALPVVAGFAGIPRPYGTFYGPSEGHDSVVVSAGASIQLTSTIATYVNYDGQLGRDRYDSNAVTGGLRITF